MVNNKKKLPQNIHNLLMEIGEKSVLYMIYLLVMNTSWEVYNNINESGCDLVILNSFTNEKVKLEVKTRQRLYTTSDDKKKNTVHFTITENEYNNCDLVVCYWFDENSYFIVPKDALSKTSSNDKPLYKFVVNKLNSGIYNDKINQYHNNWDILKDKLGINTNPI